MKGPPLYTCLVNYYEGTASIYMPRRSNSERHDPVPGEKLQLHESDPAENLTRAGCDDSFAAENRSAEDGLD